MILEDSWLQSTPPPHPVKVTKLEYRMCVCKTNVKKLHVDCVKILYDSWQQSNPSTPSLSSTHLTISGVHHLIL